MSEGNGRSHINRNHWWAVVVDDAAQLADALNEADLQGFDVNSVHSTPTGFVIVVKSYITRENEALLAKGPSNAKKEKEATAFSASGGTVHNNTPALAAVGVLANRRGGNGRAKK
jgi:hypothetical protein